MTVGINYWIILPWLVDVSKLGEIGGSGISANSGIVASWLGTKIFKLDFCRATVDGNSVRRKDSCRLNGEFS